MKIRRLAKDGASGEHGCPAAYLAESGEFVIQGQRVDDDTMSRLQNPLSGETAVRINVDVIAQAIDRYRQEGKL